MTTPPRSAARDLLARALALTRLTQRELAQRMEGSERNFARWKNGSSTPEPRHWHQLARVVHPLDADLAAAVARAGGATLVSLGLGMVPVPEAVPAAAPAPPPVPARHLGDSIVCAAADQIAVTTSVLRPALLAAFARAEALGLTVAEAHRALQAPDPLASPPAGL